jgi:5-methylcytosine-specific restriction endonuclease McrA
MVRRYMDPLAAWPHCSSCTCAAPPPRTFVSDVRQLPVDLERMHLRRPKSGAPITYKVADMVSWKPDRHTALRLRLITYNFLLDEGEARNVREAVKLLQHARRRWHAQETARHAERLRNSPRSRNRNGYGRGWARKHQIMLAEGKPCAYCGDPGAATIDHVVPSSRGGDHRRKNLAAACWSCNSQKGNKTPQEWQRWRLARGLSWPPAPQLEHPVSGVVR